MNIPPKRRRLFPDDNEQLTSKDIKAFEQEMRSRASIYTESPQKPQFPDLIFPHRYESLEAIAKETGIQLRPIIRPVLEALEIIKQEMDFVSQTARGRLFVISGVTGSGKTTFLHSLHLFSDENFKIYDLKNIDLSSRQDIEAGLKSLNRDKQLISVVFLEGYEISGALNETQIDTLLTTLNTDFRSDTGRKTLFVIPTTSAVLAQNIGKKAMETGGMTSRDRQFYIFDGPPKNKYVEITSETIRTFNDNKTLLDYGVDDDLARDIAETSDSIGQLWKIAIMQ